MTKAAEERNSTAAFGYSARKEQNENNESEFQYRHRRDPRPDDHIIRRKVLYDRDLASVLARGESRSQDFRLR